MTRRLSSFRWAIHNCVGHPLMAILHCAGLRRLGDLTLPRKDTTP